MIRYIAEIVSRAPISSPMSHSVARMSRSGHISALYRINVIAEAGIMMPVNGRAIRLVSRKYRGKVPKYMNAIGPVVSWQAIDIAAEFHIHLAGPVTASPAMLLLPSGHMDLRRGKMNAMPAMAAYESWNPTERMDPGSMHRWIMSAAMRVLPVLL